MAFGSLRTTAETYERHDPMFAYTRFSRFVVPALILVTLGGSLSGCAPSESSGSGLETLTVEVPLGTAPRIDGVLSPGEWDGALHVEIDYARHLYMMQSEGYLYLGIDSGTMGYGSSCIDPARFRRAGNGGLCAR